MPEESAECSHWSDKLDSGGQTCLGTVQTVERECVLNRGTCVHRNKSSLIVCDRPFASTAALPSRKSMSPQR